MIKTSSWLTIIFLTKMSSTAAIFKFRVRSLSSSSWTRYRNITLSNNLRLFLHTAVARSLCCSSRSARIVARPSFILVRQLAEKPHFTLYSYSPFCLTADLQEIRSKLRAEFSQTEIGSSIRSALLTRALANLNVFKYWTGN